MGRGSFAQSPALLEQLERHDWPGNVRELRNVVERALSLGELALLADLGESRGPRAAPMPRSRLGAAATAAVEPRRARAAVQGGEGRARRELRARLPASRCSRATTATSRAPPSEAGIDRNYIHRLVKKYGLEVDRG